MSAPQQWPGGGRSKDGFTVLNAASRVVLERTVVEAFVKLVVCRKVTVQKVAAGSGQVLDSYTTQEEDTPVILDVHRHEIGDDCSTRRLYPQPGYVSDAMPLVPTSPLPSASSREGGGCKDNIHHDKGFEDEDGHGRDSSHDFSPEKGQSLSRAQKYGEMLGSACVSKKTEGDRLHKSPGTRCRYSVLDKEHLVNANVKPCVSSLCGDGRLGVNTSDFTMCKSTETSGDPQSSKTAAAAVGQMGERCRGSGMKHREALVTKRSGNPSEKDPIADMAAQTTCGRESSTQQSKNAMDEEDLMPPVEDEELIEDSWAEVEQESGQGPAESGERTDVQSERSSEMGDGDKLEVEMTPVNSNDTASGVRKGFINVQVDLQSQGCPPSTLVHKSCSQSASDGIEDTVAELREGAESLGNKEENEKIGIDHDEGNARGLEDKMEFETNTQKKSRQSTSCDGEQDMRVINIFNTVLEENPQTADKEQTHPNTDGDQTQLNTDSIQMGSNLDSEQACRDTDSQQILQNRESESVNDPQSRETTDSSAPEQRTQNTEKPDPFVHLLTNFPVLDRSRNRELQSSGQCEGNSQRLRTGRAPPLPGSATIKVEPDDDCMITAAFISSSRKSRVLQRRPAPHTVTSQTGSAAPSKLWRGALADSPQQRKDGEQHGQYRTSMLLQFQQPVQGGQMNLNVAATRTSVSYKGTSSSSSSSVEPSVSSASLPSASRMYIPNFLATKSPVSEHMDSGAGVSAPAEGHVSMEYSQTFQCPLCSKIFMHQHKYIRHLEMCGGCRPFKCKTCHKAFNQRAHLDTHMKFHMGIKRYRCDVCDKAYVMKGDLIRHLKTRAHLLTSQTCALPEQS